MIYLDMTSIIEATEKTDIVSFLKRNVTQELITAYPKLEVQEAFFATLANAEALAGNRFIMINISLDYDGLAKTVAELVGGIGVKIDTKGFANDLVTFRNRDDVLTLLIHLGYLVYDEETQSVHIPNEEIRREFARTIREVRHGETIRRVQESDQLIFDTVHGNADAVAAQIEKIHAEETAPLFYHNEQAVE